MRILALLKRAEPAGKKHETFFISSVFCSNPRFCFC